VGSPPFVYLFLFLLLGRCVVCWVVRFHSLEFITGGEESLGFSPLPETAQRPDGVGHIAPGPGLHRVGEIISSRQCRDSQYYKSVVGLTKAQSVPLYKGV